MSRHLDLLGAARRALLTADAPQCAAELAAFEALCEAEPPSGAVAAECRGHIATLGLLANACLDGAAAASRQLHDALAAAGHLTTYDSAGSRATRAVRPATQRRF